MTEMSIGVMNEAFCELRELLGAHPRESIEEAAARTLRDALPGRARLAAETFTNAPGDSWARIFAAVAAVREARSS